MAANSKIAWTHDTFNPWWGCEKVAAGCANCYAERDSSRRYPELKLWGQQCSQGQQRVLLA
jgi:protein gp37